MAESRFIKTVAFGGYDRNDVIRRLEYLNTQIFNQKNELRETKLLLEGYKKGTDSEKNAESVIAGERAKLTQVQVQNENLTTKLKAAEEDNRNYEQKIKGLEQFIDELKDEISELNVKLAAASAENEAAALTAVFVEAKKSADMLVTSAKEKSAQHNKELKEAAQRTIEDANKEAENIIREAEIKAAEVIAEAKNNSSAINVASENTRAAVLQEISGLNQQIAAVRESLKAFEETSSQKLDESQKVLGRVEDVLKDGGVPQFREPERFEPDYPEEPEKIISDEEMEKRKNSLDKLVNMAKSLGGSSDKDSPDDEEGTVAADDTKETAEKNEKTDDDKTEVKAESKAEKTAEKSEDTAPKKKSSLDLAALAAKAKALGEKK